MWYPSRYKNGFFKDSNMPQEFKCPKAFMTKWLSHRIHGTSQDIKCPEEFMKVAFLVKFVACLKISNALRHL
jgi:hypothetical protein